MFAMQYTGTVNPNLLKGTSNEWSEWVSIEQLQNLCLAYHLSEPISTYQYITFSAEIQAKKENGFDIDAELTAQDLTGKWFNAAINSTNHGEYWVPSWGHWRFTNAGVDGKPHYCSCSARSLDDGDTFDGIYVEINYLKDPSRFHAWVRYRKIKLELGTVATPWCKHVDD